MFPLPGPNNLNIFLADKPNGKKRFILNLKKLNKFILAPHFKMEDYRTALKLITPGAHMTTVDLKDAYITIPIDVNDRKFLRFVYNNNLYEFTCVPFGLASAPFCFTKLMKPIVSNLRQQGVLCVNYLDDFLIIGDTAEKCSANTKKLTGLLERLGFIINWEKSILTPNTKQKFLGFIFDSNEMEISLPTEKRQCIKYWAVQLRNKTSCKIRDLAKFLGILVSACPAVKYGWAYTKSLEREKFLALARNEF